MEQLFRRDYKNSKSNGQTPFFEKALPVIKTWLSILKSLPIFSCQHPNNVNMKLEFYLPLKCQKLWSSEQIFVSRMIAAQDISTLLSSFSVLFSAIYLAFLVWHCYLWPLFIPQKQSTHMLFKSGGTGVLRHLQPAEINASSVPLHSCESDIHLISPFIQSWLQNLVERDKEVRDISDLDDSGRTWSLQKIRSLGHSRGVWPSGQTW